MFFPEYNEDDEPIDIRSEFSMTPTFDECIIGHAVDGQNVYSFKKMVKKAMEFDLDQFEAEEFVTQHIINVHLDLLIMMDLHH
jgi:hypothetical protein